MSRTPVDIRTMTLSLTALEHEVSAWGPGISYIVMNPLTLEQLRKQYCDVFNIIDEEGTLFGKPIALCESIKFGYIHIV